ncbi:hypothetical protein PVK06_012575 [Gossypium arboreum]|uniref:Histone deacetylase complex subunit SAP30 Sin3 binding domain-containing protein n=1 Tax=Gossypium arboreum TaxID=29729 RepID=A0ABR0QC26_GOSAR|nr:hypothetical protein PVK06_012575 [Gossypium arboreum]
MYEHFEGIALDQNKPQIEKRNNMQSRRKIISDLKMKDAKPDSSNGLVIGTFNDPEHAKNPAVPMYEHAEGDAWEQNQSRIEKQNNNRSSGETISDIKMKNVKLDSSTRLKIKLRNFKEEERAKNPPVPMYEPAEGKTISDLKMKDVKPDSSSGQTIRLVTKNFEESEHGKNSLVRKKKGHCSRDVTMQKLAEGDAEDNGQDLIMKMSEFKMNDVKSEHGKNRGVRTERHTTQVNFAKLETNTLRRYIRYFKIKGIRPGSSRVKIINAVQQHFASIPPLDEQQVMTNFIDAVRKNKGKT